MCAALALHIYFAKGNARIRAVVLRALILAILTLPNMALSEQVFNQLRNQTLTLPPLVSTFKQVQSIVANIDPGSGFQSRAPSLAWAAGIDLGQHRTIGHVDYGINPVLYQMLSALEVGPG